MTLERVTIQYEDMLFDVLNESDELNLRDIQADERNNGFFCVQRMEHGLN